MSDVDPFFSHYAERFMASDVDAVSAMYVAPMLAFREGRAIHLADKTAVREHLTELMAAYAQSGAARADIASNTTYHLLRVDRRLADPVVHEARRLRPDGPARCRDKGRKRTHD